MGKLLISVIGGHKADKKSAALAHQVGKLVAECGAILICGGLGGVMEHAACGAKKAGGTTVGILPGADKNDANPYIDIPIPTGLGYTRNTLVAGCPDIVIALPGKEGTLSEIGFALSSKKPVFSLKSWDVPGVIKVRDINELEKKLKKMIKGM